MKNLFFSLILLISSLSLQAQTNFTDTKGELSISSSGQASYNLPIALPPSLKNVAPVINLTYNSGQRGGIAGQGWNINGISSITRMATRVDIDGFRDGVDFDDNDKLSFDGQRLLIKTGVYWANNSTYETEYKSNTRIELKISGTVTYFIVTSPDGSQTWYGSSGGATLENAVSLNSWFIVKFKDSFGNYIKYNYVDYFYNGIAQKYIDNIQFSGNETQNLALLNQIKFNYRATNASRVEVDYMKGQAVYAFKVLENVQVLTGGAQFRKYKLTQVADFFGYERVSQVQEFNGADEPSNPVMFEYNTTSTTVEESWAGFYNGFLNLDGIKLRGDFDGDGRLDFVANNAVFTKTYLNQNIPPLLLPFIVDPKLTFTSSAIINNKLLQKSTILNINENAGSLDFKTFFHNETVTGGIDGIVKTVSVNNVPYHDVAADTNSYTEFNNIFYPNFNNCSNSPVNSLTKYIVGDFNGDGVSETIFSTSKNERYYNQFFFNINPDNNQHSYVCYRKVVNDGRETFIVDMKQNSETAIGTKGYSKITNLPYLNEIVWRDQVIGSVVHFADIIHAQDFNGDGKDDLMVIKPVNQSYKIISFKQLTAFPWVEAEIIGEGTIPSFTKEKPFLFGDYNGDGKTDFMIPWVANTAAWVVYYSNQKTNGGDMFTRKTILTDAIYQLNETSVNPEWQDYYSYHAMDVNKDGKTDLVKTYTSRYRVDSEIGNVDTRFGFSVYANLIGTNNSLGFLKVEEYSRDVDNPHLYIPIIADFKIHNDLCQLLFVSNADNRIYGFSTKKDYNIDNQLKSVSEANGNIVQTIEYAPMVEQVYVNSTDYYSSSISPNYPYLETVRNKAAFLVTKLTATVNGVSKFQDFRYRDFISSFELGVIGFSETHRSSWYTNTDNLSKIWTYQYNDYNLKGANITTENYMENGSLLSTKTNEFETYTNPTTKQYNVLLKKQTSYDYLTNIINKTDFEYDGPVNSATAFGLQTKTTSNVYQGSTYSDGTKTTTTTYENNAAGVGSAYFIGKPKTVFSSNTIYPFYTSKTDTRTSEEIYTYTGANLTKIEKKGHNTPNSIFEDLTYDNFGNLLTKTVSCPTASPALASRTITDEYDPTTKRFVVKKTDHQGFQTLLQYNNLGQVTKSTNYMGVVSDFVYDNWGKLTSSTTTGASLTPLTSTTVYSKLSDGGYTTTNTNNTDAALNTSQYDVLGRVIKSTTKGFSAGTTISKSVVYDALGRKTKEYEPYFIAPNKYTAYTYDFLNRPKTVTAPTGRLQTLTYNGLTTTSVDNTKTTSAKVDALGNKVQTTDEGGTILFKYYANGQVKETDYGGHKITIGIDGWGNKIAMTDPNAGTYTYGFDEFGQSISETTPKGTTSFAYDNFGKLITKTILGDGADFVTTYAYNSFAQLLSETSNKANNVFIDNYTYGYDSLKRLNVTTETNPNFTHSKTITFDTYGRIATENNLTTDTASGFNATVLTRSNFNAYNGLMDKLTDANNAVLWQLNTANEKMQALTATLGNGIAVTNVYDADNYFVSQRHKKNTTDVLYNTYNFNAVKGTLNNRQNVVLGINEVFTYDNLDRLTSWTNPANNIVELQTYDTRGRIDQNRTGTYKYNNPAANGMYRKTSIELSASGTTQYTAKPLQTVNYTMFKTPITINESSLGGTAFEYNSHLSRTKMSFGWSSATAPINVRIIAPISNYTKSKFYTDDGSTEIITASGKIRIITYIGGDAYGAPLYNEKVKTTATGVVTDNNYYLHRDYLGSIIAISNQAGVAIERRQFDAWGNLSKLQKNGVMVATPTNNSGLVGLMVLERGYTSHEHLAEVGLINMNGRLYDPTLHTFLMPDNFVQQPENTQNYNRYGYVLNNPLRYTDPSGESFWRALGNVFSDAFKAVVNVAVAVVTVSLAVMIIPTALAIGTVVGIGQFVGSGFQNSSILNNQFRIVGGLFQGNIGQIASRLTKELPQTLMGLGVSLGANALGRVRNVSYYSGATVVQHYSRGWGAFTLGSFINGSNGIEANPNNSLFRHEYGHYLQSQDVGWNYMYDNALPSVFSAEGTDDNNVHEAFWTEQDANIRGRDYFGVWDYVNHPIFGSGQNPIFDRDYGHLRRNNPNRTSFGWWLSLIR